MANQLIRGFAFSGFRSFSSRELMRFAPLSPVHLIAGPNNAGKSNALKAFRLFSGEVQGAGSPDSLDVLDAATDAEGQVPPRFAYAVDVDDFDTGEVQLDRQFFEETFSLDSARDPDGLLWFEFELISTSARPKPTWTLSHGHVHRIYPALDRHRARSSTLLTMQGLSSRFTQQSGGESGADGRRVLNFLVNQLGFVPRIPTVVTVDAIRTISEASDEGGFEGAGLIERLAELQNPSHERPEDIQRFDEINRFVQELFADKAARLEVPHHRETLLVHHEGRRMPLGNYGTGLQQVVILAAAATVLEKHVLCIEEPEVHLHPSLQRALLRYLSENTSNQYLIATHSAHMLDSGRASISSLRKEDGRSVAEPAFRPEEIATLAQRLGARASDLVQANAVIWVEGPSDRTYLREWIQRIAPELQEGIHYSLMFYGGSTLTHLSSDDPSVDGFVSLPRINRNFAVVIDSDRTGPRKQISATKKRVRDEILAASTNSVVWITKGYTVENYLPTDTLREAVGATNSKASSSWDGDPYLNPLSDRALSGRRIDKTKVATEAVKRLPEDAWPLDLKIQVKRLVDMIRNANDIS